jgi:hypothetical protein
VSAAASPSFAALQVLSVVDRLDRTLLDMGRSSMSTQGNALTEVTDSSSRSGLANLTQQLLVEIADT